ncbi:MAG: hypothetical protein H8E85_03110, partial [Candidatus Marinimicrobia bacterium]|nr:hypothetical protein [Candidatus Neomarinimicrobiota bacterium]
MNIVRLISFTILMGTFLLANSNSENLPTPIPIDFGENTGMRIDSTICESCNTSYEADVMGASCCDEATQFNSDFTCEILETTYLWNCSGCACTEDNESWTTDFGCMDELACNYNSDAIWGDDSCSFIDDICQSCDNGEVVDNDNDGDNICNEDEIVGCQDEIACDFNPDATDPGECSYQSTYCEDADEDGFGAGDSINFCLEDVPLGWVDNCTDSEPACATNDTDECGICGGMGAVYGNYENCCEVYVDECGFCSGTNASMDECGVCFGDNSSCMDCSGVPNGDAEPDECGVCNGPGPIYECGCSDAPTENYDCDGNCLIEIDCNDECGGSATEDECGVCDSNSANDCIQDCNGEWGGPAELDECGVCSGDGSTCSSTVSLEIQNVDVENGLLDIYMANTEEVSGFQMEMTGISITDATAPAGFMVSTSSTTILAFSLTGATIPVGEGVLTQVSFTDYMGDEICFGEDTGSAGGTAISGVGGVYIPADWGPCFGGDETIPGCMDEDACNYNPDANEPDDCTYAEENYDCDGNCIAEIDCNNECGGTAVEDECDICDGPGAIYECGCEDIPLGDCDCNGNVEDECGECGGDGSSCSPWTELVAEGGENQISLSWEPFEFLRPSFMGRGCEDDPNICIWNSWYSDFDNQQDCEANGGIWGSYLEYFGSSCNEMVSDAGCNASILYWMVSDLCPESCGVCLDGCTDMDACNFNPDATDDDGSCELPEENYDCDGNCIVGIDCNDEC